ncbi:MAG: hypothetical protein KC431_16825 [Myxococcales bacterium]|nr:hypothetical protein [Myxococcales bacterium]
MVVSRAVGTFQAVRSGVALALALAGCLPDNPTLDDGSTVTDDAESDTGEPIEGGLRGCPAGQLCTLVAVSQTLDDRVEIYSAAGPGSRYRGAIEVDLKPNPGGDITGSLLDEPYGLAWDGEALHVLLGHYPTRELSSLASFPAAALATVPSGEMLATEAWFSSSNGQAIAPMTLLGLERMEALSVWVGPGGRLLIGTFANDLMTAEATWVNESELLSVDPAVIVDGGDGDLQAVDLGCDGAWTMTELVVGESWVALACDGDEAAVVVDVSDDVPQPLCVADIAFSNKRVRFLAGDGLGGLLVAESPPIVSTTEDARLWWFDGNCDLRGFCTLEGATSWDPRQLVRVPGGNEPRWLLARADGDSRGVIVLAGDAGAGTVSECRRVDVLDEAGAWEPVGGGELLQPHALAVTKDGRGLAVGAGPANTDAAGPGYGEVWWVELGEGDPCVADFGEAIELSAAAPAVDAGLPQTWRRAPHVVEIIEVGP